MAVNQKPRGFQEFKRIMARLSWPERLEYLWEYYSWLILAAFVVVVVISLIATSVYQMQLETLFNGHAVNVEISDEGTAYVTEEWFDKLGGVEGDHDVNLYSTYFQEPGSYNAEYNSASAMSVILLISSQDLDYAIMDSMGMEYVMRQDAFASVEDVLTQEQLSQISQERFVYFTEADGNSYPAAIDISELDFVKDCVSGEGPIYIAFPGNTPRPELSAKFWDYLLSWGSSD